MVVPIFSILEDNDPNRLDKPIKLNSAKIKKANAIKITLFDL